jgi:uncharacterized membrane protein
MVPAPFSLLYDHVTVNIMVLNTFGRNTKRQSTNTCLPAGNGAPHLLVSCTITSLQILWCPHLLASCTITSLQILWCPHLLVSCTITSLQLLLCSAPFGLLYDHFTANIMVPALFGLLYDHVTVNIMVLNIFGRNTKRQSRIIFVEMHLKYITIGAEHRNI